MVASMGSLPTAPAEPSCSSMIVTACNGFTIHEAKDAFYFAAEAKAILKVRPELRAVDQKGPGGVRHLRMRAREPNPIFGHSRFASRIGMDFPWWCA